ncbi:MAG: UDP-N-acetylglucosamine 2-epimerase, partial [Gammaproteobacteria bacterium]
LVEISGKIALAFPVHPRTRKNLERFGLWQKLAAAPDMSVIEPLGYVDFMNLVCGARLTITDSGGVQEETTYLGIPCLTLRDTTERPITVTQGTNRLVTADSLLRTLDDILAGHWQHGRKPALWDGSAATRVVADLKQRMRITQPTVVQGGGNNTVSRKRAVSNT